MRGRCIVGIGWHSMVSGIIASRTGTALRYEAEVGLQEEPRSLHMQPLLQ